MSVVRFEKLDEVFCVVQCEYSALSDIADELTFEVPNSKFHPLVQAGVWDGYIRLLNKMTRMMYSGLIKHVAEIARANGYEVEIDDQYAEDAFSVSEAEEFIASLKIPFPPHDFQQNAFIHAIQSRRALILSPTSSGKSFLMYLLVMYLGLKTIIIAPSKGIVKQLAKEIKGYGYPYDIHQIMGGEEKQSDAMLTISTWHSIYKLPKKYFQQYSVLLGDEVHRFDSKCLKMLMEKTVATDYKIGVTGSLDGTKTHELVLTGLFGPVFKTITTREMIDRGISSDVNIKVMVFTYPDDQLRTLRTPHTYADEVNFIISHPLRNRFIKNLAESLPGNVLILFRRVEDHGKVLYDLLQESGKKTVYYITGAVDTDVREEIRQLTEKNDNVIILASDGTTATGISINNIQHMIKTNPLKAVINNIQSIGRGLRKDGKDNMLTYYDLADDLTRPGARKKGFLIQHLVERLKIYLNEKHPVKTYRIKLHGE